MDLTAMLEKTIKDAESVSNPCESLDYALSNARGTLSAIKNPPKGRGMVSGDLDNAGGYRKVEWVIFDLKVAMMQGERIQDHE